MIRAATLSLRASFKAWAVPRYFHDRFGPQARFQGQGDERAPGRVAAQQLVLAQLRDLAMSPGVAHPLHDAPQPRLPAEALEVGVEFLVADESEFACDQVL
jgi:hypothetical protein